MCDFLRSDVHFENICRACMNPGDPTTESLFTKCLSEKFMSCTSLKVSESDLLPPGLCHGCTKLLKSFYDFRVQCRISESLLLSRISCKGNQGNSQVSNANDEKPMSKNFINLDIDDSSSNKYGDWDLLISESENDKTKLEQYNIPKNNSKCNSTGTIEKSEVNDPRIECYLCKKTFVHLHILKKHQSKCGMIKEKTYNKSGVENATCVSVSHSCGLCPEQFDCLETLNWHLETHKTDNTLSCNLCAFKGIDWADFLCHRFTHVLNGIAIKIRCWKCTKRFSNKDSLEFHVRQTHLGKRPGLCKICHKEFMNMKNWKAHKLLHAGVKPNDCKLCGKCFIYKRSLMLHLRCHSDVKKYICQTCGVAFKFRTGLTSHQFRIHNNIQSFICNHCGKTFKNSETLREHLLRVKSIKEFECSECKNKYRSQRELENHMKWHLNEKPYQCNECSKSYKSSSHLRNHRRQHTGERPYGCDLCGKSFMTSGVLKKHIMIHTGEKPHVCQVCNKAFIEKSNLKNHLRTHKQFVEIH